MLPTFKLLKPRSLEEALKMLAADSSALPIAGWRRYQCKGIMTLKPLIQLI